MVDASEAAVLVFDLGGVVIDIDFGRAFAWWASAAAADPEEIGARFAFDEAYEAHERGELSTSAYFDHLRSVLGLALPDDELSRGWNDIYLGPVAGMADVLGEAAMRWPLFAFTNTNDAHHAHWSIAYASELEVFREIFLSSDLRMRKPDPAAFTAVAARIEVAPGEIMFFDDLAENVAGAQEAGMTGVLVSSAADVRAALAPRGVD